MNWKHPIAGLLLTTAAVAPALAEDVIVLDDITAIANLEAIALDRSGSSVTVVTEDTLEASGDQRLTDFLSRLPGVNIRANGPQGTTTGITIRGASQNYISVFVDGLEVSDPSQTQVSFDFGALSTADISRIEVLKGAQSALYGSEAVGGVINITTKRARELGTEHSIAAEYGSYNTLRGSYSLAYKGESNELALTFSRVESDGFSAADENQGNSEADGFSQSRLTLYTHQDLQGGARIGFSAFVDRNEGDFDEFGGTGGDGTPGDEYYENRSHGARGFAEFSAGGVDHTLDYSLYDAHRVSVYNGFPAIFDGARYKLSYQGATDLGATTRLVFGADHTKEEASDNFGFSADNRVNGVFAELNYAPTDRFDLAATLRHDGHSDFGGYTTGRLAASFRPQDDLIFRAAVGTGFRAPSNYELYSGFGDTTLTPEESLSAELGVEKRYGDRASVRATAFYLEVQDLIDFDFASTACLFGPGCYAQVPGTSRRSGLELEGTLALNDRITLAGSYTYTDSSSNASSAWAAVPRHDFGLTVAARMTEALTGAITAEYLADRQNGLPDYGVVNATLSYHFDATTEAYVRIENLFDNEYQSVPGYGTSDRAFYVGLRKSF